MFPQTESNPVGLSATATIPELQLISSGVKTSIAVRRSFCVLREGDKTWWVRKLIPETKAMEQNNPNPNTLEAWP